MQYIRGGGGSPISAYLHPIANFRRRVGSLVMEIRTYYRYRVGNFTRRVFLPIMFLRSFNVLIYLRKIAILIECLTFHQL